MRTAICPTHLHFHHLASHFLALTAADRFLRFGWILSDVDLVAYVESLLRSIGNVVVVVEPAPDISGALHLECRGSSADLGLSVSAWARGKGIGTVLLERAAVLARAHGIRTLFVRNLNFNAALQRLAHRVGMSVACAPNARSTRLELSANGPRRDPTAWAVTLADDSLRSHWGEAAREPSRDTECTLV